MTCVSPGCANCYACRQGRRFAGPGKPYHGLVTLTKGQPPKWTGQGRFVGDNLHEPLAWRDPSTVFVDSMSDLFFDKFSFEQIAAVYGVMAATRRHTYQILTKRPERALAFYQWIEAIAIRKGLTPAQVCLGYAGSELSDAGQSAWSSDVYEFQHDKEVWPLPNVWIGASAENRDCWNDRMPLIAQIPAAIRMYSLEPLLGPIELGLLGILPAVFTGGAYVPVWERVDWIIVGAESGPRARRCELDWVRSLRDQCAEAKVPFFFKQGVDTGSDVINGVDAQGRTIGITCGTGSHKKGRGHGGPVIESPYLDNVQHLAFPEVPCWT